MRNTHSYYSKFQTNKHSVNRMILSEFNPIVLHEDKCRRVHRFMRRRWSQKYV